MVSRVTGRHDRHRSTRIFQHKVSHHVPHILATSIRRNLPSLLQKKRGHLRLLAQLPECPAFPFQFCFSHYPVTRFSFVSVKNGVPVKKFVIAGASPTTSYSSPRTMNLSLWPTVEPAGKKTTTSTICRSLRPFSGSVGDGTSTPTLVISTGS